MAEGTPPPPPTFDSLGGTMGIIESVVPPLAFVLAYTIGQDSTIAAIVAVGVGVALALLRLIRGQSIRYALSGLIGVALAAFIVAKTGKAENFFLPGLLANAAYALGCFVSIIIGRPVIGIAYGVFTQSEIPWRVPVHIKPAAMRATWIWVGVFLGRLVVQLPLYLTGAIVALGIARAAMGLPLAAAAVWFSWLLLKPAAESVTDDSTAAESGDLSADSSDEPLDTEYSSSTVNT